MGEFVSKQRMTHDLSFPGIKSKELVNSRLDKMQLKPCMFGHTMSRIIHQIVNLRKNFPQKRIWIRKEDFKSAYRRLHVNAETALKSAVRISIDGIDLILISLRLVFGGSSCPSKFCVLSDIVTDLTNNLLLCNS